MARFSLLTVAITALPLVAPRQAHAARTMSTHNGQIVHWEAAIVTVGYDPASPSAEVPQTAVNMAIDEAAAAWNAVPEMRVKFARAKPGETAAVLVSFCSGAWTGKTNLLGQTQFEASLSSGVVDRASVQINECDHHFVGPEDVAPGHLDLQAVLTHELGHVLGLDHTEDDSAVMYSCTGTIHNRRPNADDRRGLAAIYAPELLASPSANGQAAGFGAAGGNPAPVVRDAQPVFLPGFNGMFGFELPWPELSNAHPVRFVPTVVPRPPSHIAPASELRRKPKNEPRVAPKEAEPFFKRPALDGDKPVPTEMVWPGTPEPTKQERDTGAHKPQIRVK